MNYNYVNIIGLICDIIGVWMLFRFGLPSQVRPNSGALLLDTSEEEDLIRKKANKKIEHKAKWALFIITLGFLFQVTASIISLNTNPTAPAKPKCEYHK